MRPEGVTEKQVKLRAFPFFLGDKAKDWLYSLPSGTIVSSNELKKQFLENYFPASRTINIRNDISGIRQFPGGSFYEYWGRFKQLVESCPHHQIPDHLLIPYFYEGLFKANRSLVDAASGGGTQQVKACGICTSSGYFTDACPTLQEEPTLNANADTRASIQKFGVSTELISLLNQSFAVPRRGQAQQGKTEDSIEHRHVEQGKTREELKILPKQVENSNLTHEEHPKVFVPKPPFPERLPSPKRRKRRGRFLKPYANLRNIGIEKAMCDLGASINVMPLAIYESLNIGPLKEMGIVIQLADLSIVYPEGVLEDILVQVNELIFSVDLYVLDMTENTSPNSKSILLGRLFLKTSKTKIDVDARILSMEFDNEVKVDTKQPCD
ncbi:hypothetical protein Sango_0651800 [Sesamum angolense]|uniref:Retrotransposon gag domain-containing protein n=1 Tax=Sesamum angolense TaxID=2727404 RepID=A0AAE1X7X2_9LAMI|nr:hypothetical protein Sango_0651800 [Sesamum angolense]